MMTVTSASILVPTDSPVESVPEKIKTVLDTKQGYIMITAVGILIVTGVMV